uniref:DUF4198 domain-containing protein n=1 Tax=Chryseobacterium sp. B5 TaxID=2050562 RepID=A0A2G7T9U8_9FLAO
MPRRPRSSAACRCSRPARRARSRSACRHSFEEEEMKSNPCFASVAAAAFVVLLACAPLAQAHNVWLEPDADGAYTVQFGGHEGQLENFAAGKLKSVEAYDARGRRHRRGRAARARRRPRHAGAQGRAAAAHFDNGFFSRVGEGPMVEKPMTDNPGATSGVHALKFHKTILEWGPVTREKLGQTLEIIAKTRRSPHAGEPQQFQVLLDGQPRAGVRVSLGESGPPTGNRCRRPGDRHTACRHEPAAGHRAPARGRRCAHHQPQLRVPAGVLGALKGAGGPALPGVARRCGVSPAPGAGLRPASSTWRCPGT